MTIPKKKVREYAKKRGRPRLTLTEELIATPGVYKADISRTTKLKGYAIALCCIDESGNPLLSCSEQGQPISVFSSMVVNLEEYFRPHQIVTKQTCKNSNKGCLRCSFRRIALVDMTTVDDKT